MNQSNTIFTAQASLQSPWIAGDAMTCGTGASPDAYRRRASGRASPSGCAFAAAVGVGRSRA